MQTLKYAFGVVALAAGFASSAFAATAAADAEHGAKLFLLCRACHTVERSDPSGVGPNLWGVVGSKAGTRPGYHYSTALAESGIVWSPEALDHWLTQPTSLIPETKMAFQGVSSAQARKDLIAYLATFAPKTASANKTIAPQPERD